MRTCEEQLAIAIETLRRLADEKNMTSAAASMSRFGSAGAGMAYSDIQKYAAETLVKMGVADGEQQGSATTQLEDKVRAQSERFEKELPELIAKYRGQWAVRWVVYLDGPQHFARTEADAIRWAFSNLEAGAGFVIAEVDARRHGDIFEGRLR